MLASTISSASLMSSCSASSSGERGRAMRPVRVDSRIPKGAMSFMKESIRLGLAELGYVSLVILTIYCGQGNSQFNNTVVCADIQDLALHLVREICDGLEMLMLVSQRLGQSQFAGMEVIG